MALDFATKSAPIGRNALLANSDDNSQASDMAEMKERLEITLKEGNGPVTDHP